MEKDSALHQLMDTCMSGVMNGSVSGDGEYQAILRKSDIYSGELDRMDLSKEVRLLIDLYVSEQNAHSTCAIDLGMGCSPICLGFPQYIRRDTLLCILTGLLAFAASRQNRSCKNKAQKQ